MATKLFLRDSASDLTLGSATNKLLSNTQGSALVSSDATATVGGPTTGVQVKKSAIVLTWFSNPVRAITISGIVTFNLWGLESSTQANTGFDVLVERCDQNGNVISTIIRLEHGTELGTSAAVRNWTGSPTSTNLSEGDRIKVTVFGNDAGGNMGNGRTFTLNYGAGIGVNGDSFVQLNENITFGVIGNQIGAGTDLVGVVSAQENSPGIDFSSVQPQIIPTESGLGIDSSFVQPSIISSEQGAGTESVSINVIVQPASQIGVGSDVALGVSVYTNLIGHWKFNEIAGTRNDSWGNNHASNQGSAVSSVSGIVGNAAAIRQGGYLSVPDGMSNSITGDFTAVIPTKLISGGTNNFTSLMGKWGSTGGRAWHIRYQLDINRFIGAYSTDGTGSTGTSKTHSFVPSDGVQYWIWLRKTGTLLEIRVSTTSSIGSWESAPTAANSSVFGSSEPLEFGRLGTSTEVGNFDLDSAFLWNASISDSILSLVWNNGTGLELSSPIAKAGFNQVRKEGERVMLDSSRSTDDIAITSRTWEQLSGISVELSDTSSINPIFTAPSAPAILVFRVTVQNAQLQTSSAEVTVTIVAASSNTWLWHTPQEANMNPAGFYDAFDSMPSPCIVTRYGRIIGSKGDVTLPGLTWSASKMLTSMVAARQIRLGNITLPTTIPGSDVPSSPTATLFQFLNMTSDYNLDLPSHSPGDHFAYNNESVHFYGTYLRDTFYNGQTRLQVYLDYMSFLNKEDTVDYPETTWSGDNHMSGWNGGVLESTRDFARDMELVRLGGKWNGVQVLDGNFCINELWQQQIPDTATASTDTGDEFSNQAETTAVMKDDWSLGWWYLTPEGIQSVPVEYLAAYGKYGTSGCILRTRGIIAASVNVGGTTDDSPQTRILNPSVTALFNSAFVVASEIGLGTDSASVNTGIIEQNASENGVGTDEVTSFASQFATETIGIDSVLTEHNVSINEFGIEADESSIQPSISVNENEAGLDFSQISVSFIVEETLPGIDDPLSEGQPTGEELFPGFEITAIDPFTFSNESFPGIESSEISISINAREEGIGSNFALAIEGGNEVLASEIGLTNSQPSIFVSISTGEILSETDLSSIEHLLSVVELGIGADSNQIIGNISSEEIGIGSDSAIAQAPNEATVFETVPGSDQSTISVQVIFGDVGAGFDESSIFLEIDPINETFPGIDFVTIQSGIFGNEIGLGTDSVSISVSVTFVEQGVGFELVQGSVSVSVSQGVPGTHNSSSIELGEMIFEGKIQISVVNSGYTFVQVLSDTSQGVIVLD